MKADKYIIPSVIGVDIGCGIDAYCLGKLKNIDLKSLDKFIKNNVPSGTGIHKKMQGNYDILPELEGLIKRIKIPHEAARVYNSIGTLGGGNHFIELEKDNDGNVWLVIHSGSRKLGFMTATYHQNVAKEYMKKEFDGAGAYYGLEYLDINTNGQDYLNDLKIVQKYAELNRFEMAKNIIQNFFKIRMSKVDYITSIHNYYNFEDGIVRKGAISAKKGEELIIPLNMRDGSIIGVGKGNVEWNISAPHGAGRILSRGAAKNQITLTEFKDSMKGIYTSSVCRETIDESPFAYKSSEEIKELITDTVDIKKVMKPIYNFKAKN